MPTYLTPGVYFERPRQREQLLPQRTDVAGLVGLAERGPLHSPQRLTGWREFQQLYGGFLPYAHLAYAVRAFFENGGAACFIVRVAHRASARRAEVMIPDPSGGPDLWACRAIDEGTWGNELAISLQAAHLGATRHVPLPALPPDRLAVANIAGLEPGSWVRLSQPGAGPPAVRRVTQVDPLLGLLTLHPTLAGSGLDPAAKDRPISMESLEFTLLVWQEDQVAERFAALAPDPAHPRYAPLVVNEGSRLIRLEASAPPGLPPLPWRGPLASGANGLRDLDIYDLVGAPEGEPPLGLAALAREDEVGLLAIPDLAMRPEPPPPVKRKPPAPSDPCALGAPWQRYALAGRVVDGEAHLPLPGVKVSDGLREAVTDALGRFALADLPPGSLDLLLTLPGYAELACRATVKEPSPQDLGDLALAPIDLPPALDEADIAYGQQAMIAQCEALRDRFALLDPPLTAQGEHLDPSGILAWRARFDTPFAALYYPWLRARDPLAPAAPQGRLVPPSGHVAGAYAATDLAAGVHRPAANRALAFADDVAVPVDDALHGLLNPQGVNAIRALPGRGIRILGARTLSSEPAWRYVNVRRLMSMLEEALRDGLQWAVFEPNDDQLRLGVRLGISALLDRLWREGAFLGDSPEAAYRVRCDAATTPPEAQANGRLIAEIGVAPTVPYEFVVLRLGLTADELRISEV